MLESEQRAADEGLTEFVAEIRRTVRSLDKNLRGGLIEPLAGCQVLLPGMLGQTGI